MKIRQSHNPYHLHKTMFNPNQGNHGQHQVAGPLTDLWGSQRYDCPCEGTCPKCLPLQMKEKNNTRNNHLEMEADHLAAQWTQGERSNLLSTIGNQVHIHHDATAHQAAEGMHARAFTRGKHIYFNHGEYNPGTPKGQQLLAHEMAHVHQQAKQKTPAIQKNDKGTKKEAAPNVTTLVPWSVGTSVYFDLLVDTFSGQVTERDVIKDRIGLNISLPVKLELNLNTDKATGTQTVGMTPYLKVNKQFVKIPVPGNSLPTITLSTGSKGEVMINGFNVKKNPKGLMLTKKVTIPWPGKDKEIEITVGTIEGMTTPAATTKSGHLKAPQGGFTSLRQLLPFIMGSQIKLSALLYGEQTFTISPGKGGQGLALSGKLTLNIVLKGSAHDIKADVSLKLGTKEENPAIPIEQNVVLPITKTSKGITFTLPGFNKKIELVPTTKALKMFAGPLQVGALSPVRKSFPGTPPWVPKPITPPLYSPLSIPGRTSMPLGGLRFEVDNMFLMRSMMNDLLSPNSTILSMLPGKDWKKGLTATGKQLRQASEHFETDMTALMLNGVKRYLSIKHGFQTNASSTGQKAWLAPSIGISGNLPFKQLKLFFYAGAGLPIGMHHIGKKTEKALNLSLYTDVALSGTEDEWSTAIRYQVGTGDVPHAGFLMFDFAFDESQWFK